MLKFLLGFTFMLYSFISVAQKPAWTSEQLMEPADLAKQITTGKNVPVVICIGPGASIPQSIDAGAAGENENLKKLKTELGKLPITTKLVVYCGCCPFEHCPNARPAMDALKAMHFTNYFLLNLPSNLKQDWIDKGYPVSK